MVERLSNATQRAIRNIVGPDSFELLIPTVANQLYVLALALPVGYRLLSVQTKTISGTCTVAMAKLSTGAVSTPIAGLTAIAVTSTLLESLPTYDGTEVITQGYGLNFTVSANAVALTLAVSVKMKRLSGYN